MGKLTVVTLAKASTKASKNGLSELVAIVRGTITSFNANLQWRGKVGRIRFPLVFPVEIVAGNIQVAHGIASSARNDMRSSASRLDVSNATTST